MTTKDAVMQYAPGGDQSSAHAGALKDPAPPVTEAEERFISIIDATWTRDRALSKLKQHLQIAIEVELATLPIYLYTYYSINRTPDGFPKSDVARFADKAGALVLSVAVEEMLHMSLSSNILFALGQMPVLYLRSPGPFPTQLPGADKLGPDGKPVELNLSKLSCDHLRDFLQIERPSDGGPPEGYNWKTIGQIYSFIRCVILSKWIEDEDFHAGDQLLQIHPANYSPNCIDTVYPTRSFDKVCPVHASEPGSAAHVAAFASRDNGHAGWGDLIKVTGKKTALEAIATICDQGEGFDARRYVDPSHGEMSHYFKFLTLQCELVGYDPVGDSLQPWPAPPRPAARQFSPDDLRTFVYDFPDDPVAEKYPEPYRDVANVVSGLYQYMLIMTESIYLQPPEKQVQYFNVSLHRSMIWILDKIIQAMRQIQIPGVVHVVPAPTFENMYLGTRDVAYANLKKMCADLDARYGNAAWYTGAPAYMKYYVDLIPTLPDVSDLWTPAPVSPSPSDPCGAKEKYKGAPKFPKTPPGDVPDGEVRHACMGLNHCRGQGRTRDNACAGQGYCSTALAYSFDPSKGPQPTDHTCKVLNACKGQGGWGLYGTADDQKLPGANECATLGGCATPINAERFVTDTHGPRPGQPHAPPKSVWVQAREVFAEKVWPGLRQQNPSLQAEPPQVPGTEAQRDLFEYGPPIEWIEGYSDAGMTACGSSGMSGAGSCA